MKYIPREEFMSKYLLRLIYGDSYTEKDFREERRKVKSHNKL